MNSQTTESKKYPALLAGAAWLILAWNIAGVAFNPLSVFGRLVWLSLSGSVAVGVHKGCELDEQDYAEGLKFGASCLKLGAADVGVTQAIAPVAGIAKALPGFEAINRTTPFDVSELLTKSAMIVAPTGTGKSFLLSLILCERERLYPGHPWMVASKNNWKRRQSWAGLVDTPNWLQRKKLAFGWKYEHESTVEVAAHRETDDAVDVLWGEMQRRMKETKDSLGQCGEFELNTLIIDEFPSYWAWLERTDEAGDRREKIKDLLATGHGYQCLLWVVSVDNAVNKIGLNQSDMRQLMFVRPFKPEPFTTDPKDSGLSQRVIDLVNQVTGRRVLLQFNGAAKVMPVPHCEQEPCIDWSKEIERGAALTLIDDLKGTIAVWKSQGNSMTAVWDEICKHKDFTGNKKQGSNNDTYVHYSKIYEGA